MNFSVSLGNHRLSFLSTRVVALCLLSVLLVGCMATSRPKYTAIQTADGSSATVIFRTSGESAPIWFGISRSSKDCEGFSNVGYVYDHQRDKHPIWSAAKKLMRTLEFDSLDEIKEIKVSVPSGKPIQIQGYGNDSNSGMVRICGPITSRVTPRSGGRYVVVFAWDGMCSMTVQDATSSDASLGVTVQSYTQCEWED